MPSETDRYYEQVVQDWEEISDLAGSLHTSMYKARGRVKNSPSLNKNDKHEVVRLIEKGMEALTIYIIDKDTKKSLKGEHPPASGPEFASRMGLIREGVEGPMELYLRSDHKAARFLKKAGKKLKTLQRKIKKTREAYSKKDFESWLRRKANREASVMSDKETLKTARRKVKAAKDRLIRIAYNNPSLRDDLLPVIKKAQQLSEVDIDEGEMHELLNVDENKDMSEEYSPSQLVDELVDVTGDEKEAAGMINWTANMNPDSDFWQEAQDHLAETDYPE